MLERDASRTAVAESLQVILALRHRLERTVDLDISDEAMFRLLVQARLFTIGDILADAGAGRRVLYMHTELATFIAALAQTFELAVALLLPSRGADALAPFARSVERIDLNTFIVGGASAWHAGWALMCLAMWLADDGDDSVHLRVVTLATFSEVVASRASRSYEQIDCPRCGATLEVRSNDDDLVGVEWECVSCTIAGYYPEQALPDSPWNARAQEEPDEVAVALRAHVDAISLEWMRDLALRRIAEQDLTDAHRCIGAGLAKPALLLAGSACEAMLLDLLQLNEPITRHRLPNANHWPDRVSLETMIDVAEEEALLTESFRAAATALRTHRDLIHPNRMRASSIEVDLVTARLLVTAAVAISRDLQAAETDGRIDRFVAQQLGAG